MNRAMRRKLQFVDKIDPRIFTGGDIKVDRIGSIYCWNHKYELDKKSRLPIFKEKFKLQDYEVHKKYEDEVELERSGKFCPVCFNTLRLFEREVQTV